MADLRDKSLGFRLRREWLAYIYLLPTILVLLFLNGYPIAYSVYISMTDFGTGGKGSYFYYHYIGWTNYAQALRLPSGYPTGAAVHSILWMVTLQPVAGLLTLASPITGSVLWPIVQNSFFWAGGSVVLFLAGGLGLATVLNQEVRGKGIYRTLILVPWAMPAFITILVWSSMWNYNYGIVNDLLGYVGIAPIDWLQNTTTAWAALFITNFWLSFPFYTVVFLGAMQAIPHDLYEAASIDGAGSLAKFRRITLPFLKPTVIFVGLMGFLFTFNNFYPIYLITSGGPGSSTQIFITQSYTDAFGAAPAFATAAMYGTVDFVLLVAITLFVIWRADLARNWLR